METLKPDGAAQVISGIIIDKNKKTQLLCVFNNVNNNKNNNQYHWYTNKNNWNLNKVFHKKKYKKKNNRIIVVMITYIDTELWRCCVVRGGVRRLKMRKGCKKSLCMRSRVERLAPLLVFNFLETS